MKFPRRLKVIGTRHLTEAAFVLRLERDGVKFTPGQCASLGIPGMAVNREYSFYSGTGDRYLEFIIRKIKGGVLSEALAEVSPGDELEFNGPFGEFVLRGDEPKVRYLFVATGTGIAPFHSMARSYPRLDFTLLHGVRRVKEMYDRQDYLDGRYIACVSGEKGGDFSGRVTGYLKKHLLKHKTICYLCGSGNMIIEVYEILRKQGISGNAIHAETFF